VVNPRTLELEVAKDILSELFDIRNHEVDEMIKQRLEERTLYVRSSAYPPPNSPLTSLFLDVDRLNQTRCAFIPRIFALFTKSWIGIIQRITDRISRNSHEANNNTYANEAKTMALDKN